MKGSNDNRFLYAVRFIACLFVITIHAPFQGLFGDVISGLSRFAVPFFFAVSGRFLLEDGTPEMITDTRAIRKKVSSRLKKLLIITAATYSIYTIYSFIYHLSINTTFFEWLDSKYNPFEAKIFFLFNSGKFIYDGSYTFDHLWYLFALIYVYLLIIIFAPVLRKWYKALIAILLFFLYFGEILQSVYPIRPFDISISTWYVIRNWLFVGIPYVLIGVLFSDHIKKKGADAKLPLRKGAIAVAAGACLSVAERLVIGPKEVYIGSTVIVVGLLILSECGLKAPQGIYVLGKRASSNIYYYHVLIIAILDHLSQKGIIFSYSMWQKPLIVIILCTLIFGALPLYQSFFYKEKEKNL